MRKGLFCEAEREASSAQNLGREGLHIMSESMHLVHGDCGTGHFTVGGADNDLRKALAIASDEVHRGNLEPYTGASRAGVSLKTRDKCGLGQLRLATDGPGPGERQERRALQRHEKQAAARQPVGRVWPFSRRRPVRLTACGRLVGGEQPGGLQSSEQHEATGERTASANTALRKGADGL